MHSPLLDLKVARNSECKYNFVYKKNPQGTFKPALTDLFTLFWLFGLYQLMMEIQYLLL